MGADTDTLWAVIVGAVLATVGGFAATRLEGYFSRRERERSAALLFGELMSAIELISVLADDARKYGDPYGPVTMRFLRAMRRETEAYERNRESLYDLRDGKIRAQIHSLMVQILLPLEGVFDSTDEIALARAVVNALEPADPARTAAQQRLDEHLISRDSAFDFMVETAARTKPVIEALSAVAKETFDAYATVVERP